MNNRVALALHSQFHNVTSHIEPAYVTRGEARPARQPNLLLRPTYCSFLRIYLLANREANKLPLSPKAELQWWYQYYFATERGVLGYDKYRHDFGKLIWQIASPKWNFDDGTFDRSAASFENPDYVAVVIHNYRYRLSVAEGEPQYEDLENRLAGNPVIAVPTITLEGDANGAPHYLDDTAYRKYFTGKYANRIITGGVGHNLPQETPQVFAQAVIDVDGY
jgi:hypothetical protein